MSMNLSMSLEEMLAMVGTKHKTEVESYRSELAALRESNVALTRQLQVQYRRKQRASTTGALHRAVDEATIMPNAVPTSPRSFHRLTHDGESSVDLSPIKCCQSDLNELEVLRAASTSTPKSIPSAWMPLWQHTQSAGGASGMQSEHSSVRSGVRPIFTIKEAWGSKDSERYASRLTRSASRAFESVDEEDSKTQPRMIPNVKGAFLIGLPTSPKRLAWDLIGAVLIFYDLFKLPMEAFSPPESGFSIAMDWFILIFWTANVGASLTVSHLEHGEMVLSPSKIALKYFKTWFAVDLLVVMPDWVFTIAALAAPPDGERGDEGSEDSVKLLRVLRLIRMVRLLRLLKLRKIFETFNDLINSEYVSVIANIVKMIMMLLVINHLICCVWFLLAESQKHSDSTWTTVHGFDDVDWLYKYTTSFHWSITQFTPASMHVQPQNTLERVFTLVVVVFALVGFSYIVGSITGSLAQLRSMHAEESKLFWDLRKYLTKNNVNAKLSMRIQKYLEHAWHAQQERKPVKDVKLMQFLSEQLRAELKYELAVKQLRIHPFLDQLSMYSSITVHRLANCVISHKLLAVGDELFQMGEDATHMYIVVEGRYIYRRQDAAGEPREERVDKAEDWIAEPVLWTRSWVHLGVIVAIKEGDNLTIDAKSFSVQVNLNPQAHLFASGYAQNFVIWLNSFEPDDLSDISQGEEVHELFRGFIPTDVFDPLDLSASARVSFVDHVGAFDLVKSTLNYSKPRGS